MLRVCPKSSLRAVSVLAFGCVLFVALDAAVLGRSHAAEDPAAAEKAKAATSKDGKKPAAAEPAIKVPERNPEELRAEQEAFRLAAFERARNALAAEQKAAAARKKPNSAAASPASSAGGTTAANAATPTCMAGCYAKP